MTKLVTPAARHPPPQSLREYLAGPPAVGQRALAEAAGCNQSMISMLVRGKRVPSARLAVTLHAITGVPLKMLLGSRIATRPPPLKKRRHPPGRGDPARPQASP
jgi:transcriptional regulator with XRE-family HTH domain